MAGNKPNTKVPDQRELEAAIRELEEHLARLRALLEQAREGETNDQTDWSVFDAVPREPGSK